MMLKLGANGPRNIGICRIASGGGGGRILVMEDGQRSGLGLAERAARSMEFALIIILEILALVPERYGCVCGHGAPREEENPDAPSAAVAHCSFGIALGFDGCTTAFHCHILCAD
jgi:hypothetical protein